MIPKTVRSLLDLDMYKLTMMQFIWKYYSDVKVQFEFKNRSSHDLTEFLTKEILDSEFDKIRTLWFKSDEIDYLRSLELFEEDFLTYLKTYNLPEINVTKDLSITTDKNSLWLDSTLWETIVLSTVNELYYVHKYPNREEITDQINGLMILRDYFDMLETEEIPKIVTDFGTRRRFSHDWQDQVLKHVSKNPSFSGTSNVYFAKMYGMKPIGTNAHEIYMVSAGHHDTNDSTLKDSHSIIMNQWYDLYGENLSIGLTDTFGTNFFFEDFKDKAESWKGVRHDSGDPFEFGEKVIEYYKNLGIDPKSKLIVFSDGLSINKIIDLYHSFNGRINISFGWGTKLTNNLNYETLSIVMKAVRVYRGNEVKSLVKLSDNTNKHTGLKEDIERYRNVFDYVNTSSEILEV